MYYQYLDSKYSLQYLYIFSYTFLVFRYIHLETLCEISDRSWEYMKTINNHANYFSVYLYYFIY